MQTWEQYVSDLEEAAEEACRSHRKRLGLGKNYEDDGIADCDDKPCAKGCPLNREPQDD